MNKYKELLKNMGVLTLSNFGSKLLSFFLVPLYTSVLSTEEYGSFDFINVTILLLIPLLTLNISEGALRFLLDEEKKRNEDSDICTITIKYTIISIAFVVALALINNVLGIVPALKEYIGYFIVYYIVSAIYQAVQNITRGYDKLSDIAISGMINSVLILTLNIIFLIIFKFGLDGYFLANIIAICLTVLYLIIKLKIFKLVSRKVNKKIEKEMVNYSKPLMMNSIGWWINNISDRYIVTFICGSSTNGIYSVAYKIPSILSIVQTIFNQAWTISAVKNLKSEDKDRFIKNTYSLYNLLMVICCSILIILAKILARVLYINEFYNAWKFMPFLLISIVFSALSGLLGGLFSAEKDTKVMGYTTLGGAIVNTILNIILVYRIGAMGAAISTAISCLIVWIIRLILIQKKYKLRINLKRDCIAYIILLIQAILIITLKDLLKMYIFEIVLFILEMLIFYKEMKNLLMLVINKMKEFRGMRK